MELKISSPNSAGNPPAAHFSGSPSWTLKHELAEEISDALALGKQAHLFYIGDYNPAGFFSIEFPFLEDVAFLAKRFFKIDLRYAFGKRFFYERLGVLPEDFKKFGLYRIPIPEKDVNVPKYHALTAVGFGAEADALPVEELRRRVEEAINRYLPKAEYARLVRIEEMERETIRQILESWTEKSV